jgi:hypothetical protein
MTVLTLPRSTEDWSITEANGATVAEVNKNMQQWLNGPKSPGLVILEHEVTPEPSDMYASRLTHFAALRAVRRNVYG